MSRIRAFMITCVLGALILIVGLIGVSAQEAEVDGEGEIAFEEGISAFEEGNLGLALSKFTEALKAEPGNAKARQYKGMTLLKLDQAEEAAKELEKSREINPTAEDINLDLGTAYQKLGMADKAEAAYREEIKNHPDSAEAHFSLAFLLFTQGKYNECIPEFSRTVELDKELAMAAEFYTASALYKMDKKEEAETAFEALLAKSPPPEIAKASKQYLEAIKTPPSARKNWGMVGSVLYQYDSNVVAASDIAEFPLPVEDEWVTGQEDSRAVITLSGFYRYTKFKPYILEGRYAFYQSFHDEIDMFNLQYHGPAVTFARTQNLFNRDTMIALDYRFGEALLGTDYEWYTMNHWITPSFRLNWTKNLATTLGYTYNIEDFQVTQPDRDNTAHSGFGKIDWVFWKDRASLSVSGGMDFEDAEDVAYNVQRPWAKFSLGSKLPLKIKSKLSFVYEYEDHVDDEALNRQDNVYSAELQFFRPVWGPVEVTLGGNYKKNDSNVESLTYERTIVGGGIVVRY